MESIRAPKSRKLLWLWEAIQRYSRVNTATPVNGSTLRTSPFMWFRSGKIRQIVVAIHAIWLGWLWFYQTQCIILKVRLESGIHQVWSIQSRFTGQQNAVESHIIFCTQYWFVYAKPILWARTELTHTHNVVIEAVIFASQFSTLVFDPVNVLDIFQCFNQCPHPQPVQQYIKEDSSRL